MCALNLKEVGWESGYPCQEIGVTLENVGEAVLGKHQSVLASVPNNSVHYCEPKPFQNAYYSNFSPAYSTFAHHSSFDHDNEPQKFERMMGHCWHQIAG